MTTEKEKIMEKDCVFCDRKNFEERLAGETEEFWIIATLGQISDGGYLLLVPKRHVLCLGAMEETEIEEAEFLVDKISMSLEEEYWSGSPAIFFEHGIVGQTINHGHLHFIPEPCDITSEIGRDFSDNALLRINSLSDLRILYRYRQKPYLLWSDTSEVMRICWNPPAPNQYLRIVAAGLLGRPERANWRKMDPELDRKLWSETVRRLKPYFCP